MEKKIQIVSGTIRIAARLYDTPTAEAVYKTLPLKAQANTWGDEIYFPIPVEMLLEKEAKEVVEMGDIGYWPNGQAFCIFFGPTPVSIQDEIRPASAVNVFGKIGGDPVLLKQISAGSPITVEQAAP